MQEEFAREVTSEVPMIGANEQDLPGVLVNSGCDAEKPLATSERCAVTLLLTKDHLRKMIEDRLLEEG